MNTNEFNIQSLTLPMLLLQNDVLLPYAVSEFETNDEAQKAAADDAYRTGGLVLIVPDPERQRSARRLALNSTGRVIN